MRTPLYLDAQRRLRDFILAEKLGPGDPLPPEGQLAQELGISRLSLREATKSLQTLGILQAKAGRGLFVSTFSFGPILEQLPYSAGVGGSSLAEVLQVREALETGLVVEVARRMGSDDLAELDAIVAEMAEAYARGESLADADRRFHVTLFAPLENALLTGLIELFWDLFHKLENELPAGDQHSVDVHRDLLAALRSGETDRMTRAVSDHFDGIRQSLATRS
jgi:DNA-binding FadR family transcriptional regulator